MNDDFPSPKEWLKRFFRIFLWLMMWVLIGPRIDPQISAWLCILGFILTEYLYRRFNNKKQ